uniref:Retrovirus-related Pol polyprotein from transposon TNT 1-94 n=1 Tax=Tanacetum cinerariifolium TaxID=118510 RepID=A0A6L2MEM0_TANCI|nr:retrovirus-related Pol polyprotein from transposon TNT 1-94 [Tanacetum cinerariifolium]
MLCYLAGMEPYYLKCIKDGLFQPKTVEGDAKLESQWTPDERRVVVQDQHLKSIIMSCLPDDVMESNKALVAEIFDWDEEEVFEDEQVTQVNVLMALADDELTVGKSHARNGEWVGITIRKILKAKAKPFLPCTHCSFNDHRPDDCRSYTECEMCESYDHSTLGHSRVIHIKAEVLAESSQSNESSIGVRKLRLQRPGSPPKSGFTKESNPSLSFMQRHIREPIWERIPDISYFYVFGCLVFIHNHKDHLGKFDTKAYDGYFLGYSSVLKVFRVYNTRRQQIEETYHVTFNESMEAIRFTNTLVDEIGIDNSFRYPPDEFLHKDDLFRQYQVDFDISYYVIPHGRSLTKLTQENHVPEVIVPNEHEVPLTKDIEDPPDVINIKGTHEQNVQDDQSITQPTDVPSGNNTKVLRTITEPLVPNVPQSYIPNQASTSSHPAP